MVVVNVYYWFERRLDFRSVGCLFILAILAEVKENAGSDGSYEG